jgi:uncharacterized protein with HEPN domain
MPGREYEITLSHMIDHAKEALELSHGRKRQDMDSDRLLNLSLVRLLEIIGEAANRLPQDLRDSGSVSV